MVPDRMETIRRVVEPVVSPLGLRIYDLILDGIVVRLVVDRPGGVDIDTLEAASRRRRAAARGNWTSSRARSRSRSAAPASSARSAPPSTSRPPSVEQVSVKARGDDGAMERLHGVLTAADPNTVTIRLEDDGDRTIAIDAIDQARTVFDWSPAPKPGKGSKPGRAKKEAVA